MKDRAMRLGCTIQRPGISGRDISMLICCCRPTAFPITGCV